MSDSYLEDCDVVELRTKAHEHLQAAEELLAGLPTPSTPVLFRADVHVHLAQVYAVREQTERLDPGHGYRDEEWATETGFEPVRPPTPLYGIDAGENGGGAGDGE